jgi:hypothetical protein
MIEVTQVQSTEFKLSELNKKASDQLYEVLNIRRNLHNFQDTVIQFNKNCQKNY